MDPTIALVYTFVFGSLYLGMALGFTIIAGVLRIFNLAYGALFLVAAYSVWFFWKDVGLTFGISLILAFIPVAAFAAFTYLAVVRPFIRTEDYMLAALICVFIIVEEIINYFYPEIVGVYLPTKVAEGTVKIGTASVPGQMLFAAAVSLTMIVIYLLFFIKTKTGLIMRAISQDPYASKIVGVNFDKMFVISMVIASIPPAMIIILIAPVWALDPFVGWSLFSYAIIVTVLGGLGNLKGTIIAAYIIGFINATVGFLIDPRMMLFSSLVITVAVLVVKPKGLARAESIW
ncbi:MAG: branched-chain amino acid ABC transporter permease [Archaeoglobaceae archaeon]|nr:branched-chain amino acid ABC transporter permease [Archaeoglobaceae archaeon]MCX8152517.1 branched-chain amino acid ABC transporter permease [Archaeoglobaceae archaeon]MDW8013605.1 branched-chain amino acid ABC transporter permease [Archaeoglobaceae archaeon]